MISSHEPTIDPQIALLISQDPEQFADRLQTALVFSEIAEISKQMKSVLTTAEALTQFSVYWPHVSKAWLKLCRSERGEDVAKSIDFLRLTTPLLVASGERALLEEMLALVKEKTMQACSATVQNMFFYSASVVHIQYRRYGEALQLLSDVREHLSPDSVDPTLSEVLTCLGAVYVGLGREPDAEAVFEELAGRTFMKGFSFPFTEKSLDKVQEVALDRMFSGTGLVMLLARPEKTSDASSPLPCTPTLIRRS